MGQVFSGFVAETSGAPKPSLEDIPESCLALVLARFDPPEICKLAGLNRAFHRASLADFVWESKLPENYQFLVNKLMFKESTDAQGLAKKDIYARLTCTNFIDGGTKQVWMEKKSGGICVSVSWKGMKITGIDDRRYWNPISTDESRFQAIAYLQQIWWLEVEGDLEFEFPAGNYSLFFRLQLGKPSRKLGRQYSTSPERVHGWEIKPVRFQFSTSTGQHGISQCYLREPWKWLHYHVGDFHVEASHVPMKIKFSMTQIDCTHTKGGLSVDSVLICPIEFRERPNGAKMGK